MLPMSPAIHSHSRLNLHPGKWYYSESFAEQQHMNRPLENLEAEALELAASERAYLAGLLLASLEEDLEGSSGEIESAWSEEIQNRLREIRGGRAKLVPAEDVLQDLRKRDA